MLGLRLLGFCVMALSNNVDPAGGLGGTAFVLVGPLELGATLSGETSFPESERGQLAGHIGLRAPLAMFELDAAATLGYADITNGRGWLFDDDPGATGSLGFVGGRAGAAWVFFRSRERGDQASLAVITSYEHDLAPYTAHYTYIDHGFFGEDTLEAGSEEIGSDRIAVQLGLGIGFD